MTEEAIKRVEEVLGSSESSPFGFVTNYESECPLCGKLCEFGGRVFPVSRDVAKPLAVGKLEESNSEDPRIWVHLECAKANNLMDQMAGTRKACKHWKRKGFCMFGDKCQFLHPEDVKGIEMTTKRTWGGRRKVVRNTNRAWVLINFMIETFGLEVLKQGAGVLDIAGGQGEVGFELSNLCGIDATIVDPRVPKFYSSVRKFFRGMFHRNLLMSRYVDRKPEDGLRHVRHISMYVTDELIQSLCESKLTQGDLDSLLGDASGLTWSIHGLQVGFADSPTDPVEQPEKQVEDVNDADENVEKKKMEKEQPEKQVEDVNDVDENVEELERKKKMEKKLLEREEMERMAMSIVKECRSLEEVQFRMKDFSVVVGMHPDQATECLVDLALALDKPFAVVPCCVYSNLFPKRKLNDGTCVRSYDQFVQYLLEKDASIQRATLDFGGRNTVLFRHAST